MFGHLPEDLVRVVLGDYVAVDVKEMSALDVAACNHASRSVLLAVLPHMTFTNESNKKHIITDAKNYLVWLATRKMDNIRLFLDPTTIDFDHTPEAVLIMIKAEPCFHRIYEVTFRSKLPGPAKFTPLIPFLANFHFLRKIDIAHKQLEIDGYTTLAFAKSHLLLQEYILGDDNSGVLISLFDLLDWCPNFQKANLWGHTFSITPRQPGKNRQCSISFRTYDVQMVEMLYKLHRMHNIDVISIDYKTHQIDQVLLSYMADINGEALQKLTGHLTPVSDEDLVHFFGKCTNLTDLILCGKFTTIGDAFLDQIALSCKNIISLDLSNFEHITDAGMCNVLQALSHNEVQKLIFDGCCLLSDVTLTKIADTFLTAAISMDLTSITKEGVLDLFLSRRLRCKYLECSSSIDGWVLAKLTEMGFLPLPDICHVKQWNSQLRAPLFRPSVAMYSVLQWRDSVSCVFCVYFCTVVTLP